MAWGQGRGGEGLGFEGLHFYMEVLHFKQRFLDVVGSFWKSGKANEPPFQNNVFIFMFFEDILTFILFF